MHPLLIGIVVMAIVIGGLVWQGMAAYKLSEAEDYIPIPTLIALLIVLGGIGYPIFAAFDSNVEMSFLQGLKISGIGVFVGISFAIKQYLAPLFLSATCAWAVYTWMQHGSADLIPVMTWFVNLVEDSFGGKFGKVYLWATYIYAAINAIIFNPIPEA